MSNAQAMYAMGLDEVKDAIKYGGHERTVLAQGHMGSGKRPFLLC